MKYTNMDDEKITLEIEGIEKEFDILLSFECEENGRTYIGIGDDTEDEDGNLIMNFISVDGDENNTTVYDITSDAEREMIDEVVNNLKAGIENGEI